MVKRRATKHGGHFFANLQIIFMIDLHRMHFHFFAEDTGYSR